MSNKNHLIIVGSGIKFMSHLTTEAKACIEKADKVLYLINEPLLREWIKRVNSKSESLDDLYSHSNNRHKNYVLISEYIIEQLRTTSILCVVIYGHPTILAQPTVIAAREAVRLDYNVTIIPGISAEDCLFADLNIDPLSTGCQSFEATDFLIYQRQFDPSCHIIIWQAAVIGILNPANDFVIRNALTILQDYLLQTYDGHHHIYLYEAAQYPILQPKIDKIMLSDLHNSEISRITTIYIPPNKTREPNIEIINRIKRAIN